MLDAHLLDGCRVVVSESRPHASGHDGAGVWVVSGVVRERVRVVVGELPPHASGHDRAGAWVVSGVMRERVCVVAITITLADPGPPSRSACSR